ncbi:MAG: proline--tRNA ligase [archaeon]
MSKEIGITVRKNEDLSEWFTQVITKTGMCDYAGVKGFIVFMPYSYAMWETIRDHLDEAFKETGHVNAYFPALIAESYLRKEATHFSGFVPEVFWVTQTGDTELSERLALRPTSETVVCDSYSKWVKSWRDLPILLNLWNSVFRAEITATKPFLRTSEFLWQEGHTAHATKQEAEKEVTTILDIYRELVEDQLAIPVVAGKKSEAEKFVGADYTLALEAMMPDGRALQMGTSHFLGQNFSKPFQIKYLGKDEKEYHVWQTSWGVSTRMIGALVMVHGDDKGLVLPPNVAPTQVVFVPIYYSEEDRLRVEEKIRLYSKLLRDEQIRVFVDDREGYTPGWKFHDWEMKGVPLRVEIGPRDLAQERVTVARRDNGEKSQIQEKDVPAKIREMLDSIQKALYERAGKQLDQLTSSASTFKEFKETIESKGGFIRTGWCGKSDCEKEIKNETGATIRAIPLNQDSNSLSCVRCGEKAQAEVYFARSY